MKQSEELARENAARRAALALTGARYGVITLQALAKSRTRLRLTTTAGSVAAARNASEDNVEFGNGPGK